ncbi:MAG: sigma-70 family RNA polymerase sigma factor, partial [candidate division KSB1 bacterium]|nr:sigma-70 family RNA polymerase sigma factor [candidate division KSB1 bacterium]
MFAFIRSKIRSIEESEDLLQEVFFQALSSLNALEAVDNLTGWLYTVAKNKIIDWYRKKRLPTVSIDEPMANGFSFQDFLAEEIPDGLDEETRELVLQSIMEAIEELPEKQRYVFIQQVVEGKTFRELAEETGDSINTLIARKRYAVQFLK